MDPITRLISDLRDWIRSHPRAVWPMIAAEAGVGEKLLDKVVYCPGREFRGSTIGPLLELHRLVAAGERADFAAKLAEAVATAQPVTA